MFAVCSQMAASIGPAPRRERQVPRRLIVARVQPPEDSWPLGRFGAVRRDTKSKLGDRSFAAPMSSCSGFGAVQNPSPKDSIPVPPSQVRAVCLYFPHRIVVHGVHGQVLRWNDFPAGPGVPAPRDGACCAVFSPANVSSTAHSSRLLLGGVARRGRPPHPVSAPMARPRRGAGNALWSSGLFRDNPTVGLRGYSLNLRPRTFSAPT